MFPPTAEVGPVRGRHSSLPSDRQVELAGRLSSSFAQPLALLPEDSGDSVHARSRLLHKIALISYSVLHVLCSVILLGKLTPGREMSGGLIVMLSEIESTRHPNPPA